MPHQAVDTAQFVVNSASLANIDPLDSVGRIYEVGINGQGYMLADNPEDPDSLPKLIVPSLEAQRLATTDTPLSQSIERYIVETFHEWDAGAGQDFLNREPSTSRAFADSEGVDPFTERGVLKLLPTTSQSLADTYANLILVAVGDEVYALTDADELTRFNGTWQTPVTITDGAAITAITDLASDGQYWYAAYDDTGIIRGTTTNPAAAWSTVAARSVEWAAGRVCAAVVDGSSGTPNRFTTLTPAGVEELAGGHLTLDEGHTIVLGGVAGGHFYFGSYVGDRGTLWAWQLGVDSEGNFHVPFVAWDMPQGVIPTAVTGAADEIWIRGYRTEGPSAGAVNIYRGVPGSGLTPFVVAELGSEEQVGDFDEVGDTVLFSYSDTSGKAALGAVYLPTGGYARWLLSGVSGVVSSITEWRGRAIFAVQGQGVYLEDTSSFETSGWLRTSIVDGASLLPKVLDSVTIDARPLSANEAVNIDYTLDGGTTYSALGSLATAGANQKTLEADLAVATFGFEFELVSGGSTQTKLYGVQARYHGLGLRDVVLTIRVKAYDHMTGLNGAPLEENAAGRGVEIMRALEVLGQSRILFQDVDYQFTGQAHVFEVVGVEVDRVGVYDESLGQRTVQGEVALSLRRTTN